MFVDPSRIRALCRDIDGTLADADDHLVAEFGRPAGLRPHGEWSARRTGGTTSGHGGV